MFEGEATKQIGEFLSPSVTAKASLDQVFLSKERAGHPEEVHTQVHAEAGTCYNSRILCMHLRNA